MVGVKLGARVLPEYLEIVGVEATVNVLCLEFGTSVESVIS
jgi:hypothetical protein